MFTGNDKAEVEVHDFVKIRPDCSVEIRRTYTLTNDTSQEVEIAWDGNDLLPAPDCVVSVSGNGANYLGVTVGARGVVKWAIRGLRIAPAGNSKVSLEFSARQCVKLSPLSCRYCFESRNRCHYSLEIHPPYSHVFRDGKTKGAVDNGSEELNSFVPDASGVLRTTRSVLVSNNSTGPIRIALQREKPVVPMTRLMTTYLNRGDPKPLANYVVILIPHLLKDCLSYVSALLALGLNPTETFIIGIPYSTKQEVVGTLWEMGFSQIATPREYPFDEIVRETIVAAIELAKARGKKILTIEDGGYVGPLVHSGFPESLSLFSGVVEQTANGIWQYDEHKITLKLPVVNVAESKLKKDKESPLIGRAVVHNLEVLLRQRGWGLNRYRPLVIGYGATGRRVVEALKSAKLNPVVFDSDEPRRKQAADDGYPVGDDLAKLIPGRNLIIGCTGKTPLSLSQLTAIDHGTVFANASSKRREINYDDLRSIARPGSQWPKNGWATEVPLITDRTLYLLADGYPVNFVGESVEDEEISFIYGLLIESALYLIVNESTLVPSFVDVPDDVQKRVNDTHESLLRI